MNAFAPSNVKALITLRPDTHADAYVGVALDRLSCRLRSKSVPTTEVAYIEFVAWSEGFGALDCVGFEDGSFGVGLVHL